MLEKDYHFQVERAKYGRVVNVWASRAGHDDDKIEVILNVVCGEVPRDDAGPDQAPFSMAPAAAQNLFDALWAAGFRPVDGTGNAGQLGATERHLADMRALVAHHAGAKLP